MINNFEAALSRFVDKIPVTPRYYDPIDEKFKKIEDLSPYAFLPRQLQKDIFQNGAK